MSGVIGALNLEQARYVPGRYYSAPELLSSRTADAQPTNTLVAHPFTIFAPVRVDALALRLVTGAAGLGKLGIYDSTNIAPYSLVAEVSGDIDVSGAAGDYESAFLQDVVLSPGRYWMASCFSGGAQVASFSAASSSGLDSMLGSTAAAGVLLTSVATKPTGFTRTAALTYVSGAAFFPALFGDGTVRQNNTGACAVAIKVV